MAGLTNDCKPDATECVVLPEEVAGSPAHRSEEGSQACGAPQWYFTVGLGPAQDFIAASRRTRDLFFSSWLLSDIARTVALEITRAHNEQASDPGTPASSEPKYELIFPGPNEPSQLEDESFQVTNKIVALVTLEPQTLSLRCRQAISRRLAEIWIRTRGSFAGDIDEAMAWAQILDFIEYNAAASRLERAPRSIAGSADLPTPSAYEGARRRAELLLAERKNRRDFRPPSWTAGDAGFCPKSSLDGQRESVIPENQYPASGASAGRRQERLEYLRHAYGVRGSERLCAIGLLKRNGECPHPFASTSHMAALPLLLRWNDANIYEVKSAIKEYRDKLRSIGLEERELRPGHRLSPTLYSVPNEIEGHLLYEGRVRDFFSDATRQEAAVTALRKLRATIADIGAQQGESLPTEPSPYYAVLHADGDHMGRSIDRLTDPAQHRAFSRCLGGFASGAKEIVEAHFGCLVYAGGDDVLALLPLHTALACACALQGDFANRLRDFPVTEGVTPTLSGGLYVAHHLAPLDEVLNGARRAEGVAKSVPGKNAWAITLARRGGAPRTVQGPRGELDERLFTLMEWHLDGALAHGLAYQWQDLARRLDLAHVPSEQRETTLKMVSLEASRIAARKESVGGGERIAVEKVVQLRTWLGQIERGGASLRGDSSLHLLSEELIIAAEFAASLQMVTAASGPQRAVDIVRQWRAGNHAPQLAHAPVA